MKLSLSNAHDFRSCKLVTKDDFMKNNRNR